MTTLYRSRYLYRPDSPLIEDAALLVSDGLVVDSGRKEDVLRGLTGVEIVDLGDVTILPTFVNSHTHLELTDFPLWIDDTALKPEKFTDWILHLIGVKRNLTEEQYVESIKNGIIESLNCGVGAVGDVLSNYRARSAYNDLPIRGRFFPEIIAHDQKVGRPKLLQLIEILEEGCSAENGFDTRMQMGVSPHSPYTISAKILKQLLNIAEEYRVPTMIHLAESIDEITFLQKSSGPIVDKLYQLASWQEYLPEPWQDGPLSWFMAHGGEQMIAVHGVQFSTQEIEVFGERGGKLVVCPRSNQALGVGLPDLPTLMRAGVNLSIGTDSRASVESLSIWDEIAFIDTAYSGVIDPVSLLYMATKGGTEVLNLPYGTATLADGGAASFQVVATPERLPEEELLESLLTTGPDERLCAVYIDGELWNAPVPIETK